MSGGGRARPLAEAVDVEQVGAADSRQFRAAITSGRPGRVFGVRSWLRR